MLSTPAKSMLPAWMWFRGDNPLLTAKNCLITPHISWAPKEARIRIMDCSLDNLRSYLNGEPIHVVNRPRET